MSTKNYDVQSEFSPLRGDPFSEAELYDEEVDNPLTRAAKKQIEKEEDPALDIDEKFEEVDEDEDDELEELDETEGREPEEDDEEEEPEEPTEDEGDDYSTKVKKRILREKKRADRFQNQLSETEARLARLESRWEAEADDAKLSKVKEESETKLTGLRAQKKEALEEGDTDKVIELDEQIFDVRADLRSAETKATEARQRLDETKRTGEVIDGIDLGKLPPKSREWIDSHPQFRTDDKFRRAVLATANYLEAKGLNYQSPDYWQKLEREVSDDFPQYFKKQPTIRRKPASATSGSKGTGRSAEVDRKRGKVRITADDKRNMIRFNLDPDNRDHIREYAASKLTS